MSGDGDGRTKGCDRMRRRVVCAQLWKVCCKGCSLKYGLSDGQAGQTGGAGQDCLSAEKCFWSCELPVIKLKWRTNCASFRLHFGSNEANISVTGKSVELPDPARRQSPERVQHVCPCDVLNSHNELWKHESKTRSLSGRSTTTSSSKTAGATTTKQKTQDRNSAQFWNTSTISEERTAGTMRSIQIAACTSIFLIVHT